VPPDIQIVDAVVVLLSLSFVMPLSNDQVLVDMVSVPSSLVRSC
jgi:hypothetical protein